jgi:hypothetical protein
MNNPGYQQIQRQTGGIALGLSGTTRVVFENIMPEIEQPSPFEGIALFPLDKTLCKV